MKFAVMFVTLLFATGAWAQTAPSPSPQTTPQAAPSTVGSAPVGRRQPKLSDLPPEMADRQKAGASSSDDILAKENRDLDRRLRICERC